MTYPTPTVDAPEYEEVLYMALGEEDSEATDGCDGIEPDGMCEHGYPSWPRHMGII